MKDINYYRRINGTYGLKDRRDINIKKTQAELFKNLLEHPNCQEVKFTNELNNDYVIIITGKDGNKTLIREPNKKIKRGDLIEWNDNVWICLSIDADETIYSKGLIQECNNTLTFQDPSTLQIYKLPCVLQDKTSIYSDGINEGKLIVLADDQIMVIVPNNDITKKIPTGKRFIFNSDIENIYESTKVDRLLNNGLTSIIMKRADHNLAEDNLELNIADYIQPSEQPEEPEIPDEPDNPTDYTITINGYDTVIFGTWEQYAVSVLQDGVEVDKPVKFELIGDESLAWIDDIEGVLCKVYANKERVRGTVILRVSLIEDENVYTEKEITTVAW